MTSDPGFLGSHDAPGSTACAAPSSCEAVSTASHRVPCTGAHGWVIHSLEEGQLRSFQLGANANKVL